MTDSRRLQGVHHKKTADNPQSRVMHRIATAILLAGAVLALNGGMLRDAFARETVVQLTPPSIEMTGKNTKLLSLLLVLESLRQSPFSLDDRKV